jgi:hypothetical protein
MYPHAPLCSTVNMSFFSGTLNPTVKYSHFIHRYPDHDTQVTILGELRANPYLSECYASAAPPITVPSHLGSSSQPIWDHREARTVHPFQKQARDSPRQPIPVPKEPYNGKNGSNEIRWEQFGIETEKVHRNSLGAAKEQSFIEMEEVHRDNRISESILKSAAAK